MPELERCVHQGVDTGRHVLFKEQWENCKTCTYDPENNKKCPNYSPTCCCIPYNNFYLFVLNPQKLENVRA
jgi:hypothetical protein